MANRKLLKFGPIYNESSMVNLPRSMGASEVIKSRSGRFVIEDGSGYLDIADDNDSELAGWVEVGEQTANSTDGVTKCSLTPAANCPTVFRVPLAYDGSTYTVNYGITLLGKTCDLIVVSTIQKINLTTADDDCLIVVGGLAATSTTADDGYVDVMFNPNEVGATGVA